MSSETVYESLVPTWVEWEGRGRLIDANVPFTLPPGYALKPSKYWTVRTAQDAPAPSPPPRPGPRPSAPTK